MDEFSLIKMTNVPRHGGAHINSNTEEAGADGSLRIQGQSSLRSKFKDRQSYTYSETLTQKKKKTVDIIPKQNILISSPMPKAKGTSQKR